MRIHPLLLLALFISLAAHGQQLQFKEHRDGLLLLGDGKPWMDTLTPAHDPRAPQPACRISTQLYDLQRFSRVTGAGEGKFPHQQGVFVGWSAVTSQGKTYDFWSMKDVCQTLDQWKTRSVENGRAVQTAVIRWCTSDGAPILEETRTITAAAGPEGTRVFDIATTLASTGAAVQLRGDAHHGGVQLRLADEVADHEGTTRFLLPDTATITPDDVVENASWACCSAVVRGSRYWVMHMTPPTHPGGAPSYATRPYGRVGAFFEADLAPGSPVTYEFRVLLSDKELGQAECTRFYEAYAAEHTPPAPAVASGHAVESKADEVLARLKEGNARFVADASTHPNQSRERRAETAEKGQHPVATILGCSDSREPLELIFDAGIGELFVVRVAGNVSDTDEIGSIEYGVGHLHTPLLVVLGHTKCGAVTAVTKNAEVGGSIPQLVDNIKPAVEAAKAANPNLEGDALVPAAINANVFQSIRDLLSRSKEVRELIHEGKLSVLGAVYHLDDGTVEWLGEHPKQKELLETRE